MLKRLTIEQFVIIDKLELDFASGLTILTGETGAGKSILLDAMGLVLGEPSNPDSIRQGSNQSIIKATFAPPAVHPVWKFLVAEELAKAGDTEFTIDRTIKQSGLGEILFNNQIIDVDLLKKIGTFLVEIHGQFANQSLLDPANQLNLLDLSGGFPLEVFKNVADALRDVRRFTKELEEENLFLARHKRETPKIEDIVTKFEKVGMRVGFVEEIQAEHARLRTAKETSEAFQAILAQLISGNGVVPSLSAANNTLAKQKNVDGEKLAVLTDLLSGALNDARAAVIEMGRLSPQYDIDTGPLHRHEQILNILNKITQDNKIKFEELTSFYVEMSSKLERIRNGRAKLVELENSLAKAKRNYLEHARILHDKRVIAGKALSDSITAEFAPLKLMRAEFQVLVEENSSLPWTDLGIDQVVFKGRMNPGMPFSPISETASGGELARMILALKVVVQRVQTIPTLVFDEVDTGIGGSAASAVGERLALLADTTQVLVITHSPQVASRSDQHLHVSKQTDGITTTSVVRKLTLDERTDEISRMLAGDVITPESKAAAQSLINEAKSAAIARRAAAEQRAQMAQQPPAPPPEQVSQAQ
jgi:DNA repair protein RecN (Recombination protein N)